LRMKEDDVFTVMFPTYFVPRGWKPFLVSGARGCSYVSTR
jgi:hypothetical protein